MKKILFLGLLFSFLAAGCGFSGSQTQSNKAAQSSTGNAKQNNSSNPMKNNNQHDLVLWTPDDSARNVALLDSLDALDSGNFDSWFVTIHTETSKQLFIRKILADSSFSAETINKAWPKISKIYKALYPDPKTCKGKGFIKESYNGKDYAVDYCSPDEVHAFGVISEKNDKGQWLIVAISNAVKDDKGQIHIGGMSFGTADGPKTNLITVQNHLKEILQK